jgi:type IV secretory pathway ATPase VirB11/archaellum biosynthesis ATPase
MDNNIFKNNEDEFLSDVIDNGRTILSIGAKNSGKSYVMNSFLKYVLYNNYFEFIHCIIPAYRHEQHNSYKFLNDQKQVNIYRKYDIRISKIVDR